MPVVMATADQVDCSLAALGGLEPAAALVASTAVRAVTELYGGALRRIVTLLDADALERLVADELVTALLVLHDLHPHGVEERVRRALDTVRPALGAHAGDVELLGLATTHAGPVLRLRLAGSCQGCPSSAVTVRESIERVVRAAAPEVVGVEVVTTGTGAHEPVLVQLGPRPVYAADGSQCPAVTPGHTTGDVPAAMAAR